ASAFALPILKENLHTFLFIPPGQARAHEKERGCSHNLACTYAFLASSGCTTSPAANVHGSVHTRASKCGPAASGGDCFGKRDGAGDSARRRDILPSGVQR